MVNDLKTAFMALGRVGYAEAVVEVGPHKVWVRTLTAHETSQVQQTAVEVDGVHTRLDHYVHVIKVETVARAILRLGEVAVPDYIDTGGEVQEKHLVLRELVRQWGEHVLTAIFRAYQDLEERTEMLVRQSVRYDPPDYQSGIDWHRKQIEGMEKKREERERWLAMGAGQGPAAGESSQPPPASYQEPSAGFPQAAPQPVQPPAQLPPAPAAVSGPPPGRYRIDAAPPPPRTAEMPGIQLDDASFLDPDPESIRSSIAREEERLRLERVRRAQTAALIGTEAAARPAEPVVHDGPLQRRAEALRQAAGVVPLPQEDPNELRRPPMPPGGPGRLDVNPQVGNQALNPRFVRRT